MLRVNELGSRGRSESVSSIGIMMERKMGGMVRRYIYDGNGGFELNCCPPWSVGLITTVVLGHGLKINGDEDAMLGTVCHVSKDRKSTRLNSSHWE